LVFLWSTLPFEEIVTITEMMAQFDVSNLQEDVLSTILSNFPLKEVVKTMSLTCKNWRRVIYTWKFASLWPQDERTVIGEQRYENGLHFKDQKNFSFALINFNLSIALQPKSSKNYSYRAVCFFEQSRLDLCLQDYNAAIEFAALPDKYLLNNRGVIYKMLGNFEKANEDYQKSSSLDTKYSPVYSNRAALKVAMKDWEGAVADATTCIKLEPTCANAYCHRAAANVELKKMDLAIKDCDLAIHHVPKYPRSFYIRGQAQFLLKNYKEAQKDLDSFLKLEPDPLKHPYVVDAKKLLEDLAKLK